MVWYVGNRGAMPQVSEAGPVGPVFVLRPIRALSA
jgi:hypothetical protein